jgi:hypothetical protein
MKPLLIEMSMLSADAGLAPLLSPDISLDDKTCILKSSFQQARRIVPAWRGSHKLVVNVR